MKIEDGVPLPTAQQLRQVRKSKYPFGRMQVGQSVFVPGGEVGDKAYKAAKATGERRTNPDGSNWRFVSARENDGLRIWRQK